MYDELKKQVYEANISLVKYGLVILTWGNVSGIDREKGVVAIKPSGVDYDKMTEDDIVLLDLNGNTIEGRCRPSSDTPTHLALYRAFPKIGGITHTHSRWATIFAQQSVPIPPFGTTHADYFNGAIPCTRPLKKKEINGDYELETGNVIIKAVKDYEGIPAVLVANHGPFAWGKTALKSAENAYVLEEVAMMAFHTKQGGTIDSLGCFPSPISNELLNRHYSRKHGANAYYGQQ